MRLPWPAVTGGVLVAALGAAGLIRGAMPQPSPAANTSAVSSTPIVISGAYVRAPVPPSRTAAAYFTVTNTTGRPDRLLDVASSVGADAVLHTVDAHGSMTVDPNGALIPAHGSLTLATGRGHVMIERLLGSLSPGQLVDLQLDFANAGSIDITAPVVALGAPAPTPSGAPS